MSQVTESIASDSDLSGFQSDESSTEDSPLINLQDADVKRHIRMNNRDVKKSYKKGNIIQITPENESILNKDLRSFFTQLQTIDGKPLTWCVSAGEKECVLKIMTKTGTSSTSSSLLSIRVINRG